MEETKRTNSKKLAIEKLHELHDYFMKVNFNKQFAINKINNMIDELESKSE